MGGAGRAVEGERREMLLSLPPPPLPRARLRESCLARALLPRLLPVEAASMLPSERLLASSDARGESPAKATTKSVQLDPARLSSAAEASDE